jgi:hypothetical protein
MPGSLKDIKQWLEELYGSLKEYDNLFLFRRRCVVVNCKPKSDKVVAIEILPLQESGQPRLLLYERNCSVPAEFFFADKNALQTYIESYVYLRKKAHSANIITMDLIEKWMMDFFTPGPNFYDRFIRLRNGMLIEYKSRYVGTCEIRFKDNVGFGFYVPEEGYAHHAITSREELYKFTEHYLIIHRPTDTNEPTADVLQKWITDLVSGIATEKQRKEWFSFNQTGIEVLCKYKQKAHMLIRIFPVSGVEQYNIDMELVRRKTIACFEIEEAGKKPYKDFFSDKENFMKLIDKYLTLQDGEFNPRWVSCYAIKAWIKSIYNLTDDAFKGLFSYDGYSLTLKTKDETYPKIEIFKGSSQPWPPKFTFEAPDGRKEQRDISSKEDLEAVVNKYPILQKHLLQQTATEAQWRAVDQLATILGAIIVRNHWPPPRQA